MIKLNPDERLLVESGINRYKVIGPGRVWLAPWQQALTALYIGPQAQSLKFDAMYTAEEVPVSVTIQMQYQIDPDLFTNALLSRIPSLNEGGWENILRWQTEYVLRKLLAHYAWHDLGRPTIQHRLERQLNHTLADHLKGIGLNIVSACLVKTELPANLQETILKAEQDGIEARGRATVLKEYFEVFGQGLPQTLPYIVQWELLNLLHKNGNRQLILTNSGISLKTLLPEEESTYPMFWMKLPSFQDVPDLRQRHAT